MCVWESTIFTTSPKSTVGRPGYCGLTVIVPSVQPCDSLYAIRAPWSSGWSVGSVAVWGLVRASWSGG